MFASSIFADFPALFGLAGRPWLVLGKGPSFSGYREGAEGDAFVMGLNHVSSLVRVDLAHAIDIEVIEQCGDALVANARHLVMPWIPHLRHDRTWMNPGQVMDASGITLDEWCIRVPLLEEFRRQGRLHWYNLATAPARLHRPEGRVVNAGYFGSSVAIDLLAKAGVKTIRTLGIDGGITYDARFAGLAKLTLFANGKSNFDLQFASMARTIMEHDIDLGPANLELPVRVFVGAEPEQSLAVKLLEYSIRKHASVSVVVEPLHQALNDRGMGVPIPRNAKFAPRTPFSYQRFAIPALKSHKGRAIYLDSDMLVFEDIRKLWIIPFNGAPLLSVEEPEGSTRRPQYSVALLDCEALHWDLQELIRDLDAGKWTYEEFMYEMKAAPGARAGIPSRWNDLERYTEGQTALTHFTDMNGQPWIATDNPIANVWCEQLLDAIKAGFISRAEVEREVNAGYVRPSLLAQVDLGIADPVLLPRAALALDRQYIPPHVLAANGLPVGGSNSLGLRWLRFWRAIRAALRHLLVIVGLSRGVKVARKRFWDFRQELRMANARRKHDLPRS